MLRTFSIRVERAGGRLVLALASWVVGSGMLPAGEEILAITRRFDADEFSVRRAAMHELAILAAEKESEVLAEMVRIREEGSPEASAMAEETLREVFRRYQLGMGDIDPGMEIGWFLSIEDGMVTSLPHVLEVREESPAQKAGMKPGDVIFKCNGFGFQGETSKVDFLRFLGTVKPGTELKLSVGGMNSWGGMERGALRDQFREVVFVPAEAASQEREKKFPESRFQEWLVEKAPVEER